MVEYHEDEITKTLKEGYGFSDIRYLYLITDNGNLVFLSQIIGWPITVNSIVRRINEFKLMPESLDCVWYLALQPDGKYAAECMKGNYIVKASMEAIPKI